MANMEASIGVNLRVTAHSNQGGRKYMEDMFCVAYQPTADDRDLLYAYFGIFDGHGGREAALYAKHHLMDHIVSQKNFWSDDDELVQKAIKDGFITTHYAMLKELEKWPKTPSGLPSTSGTTASIAFVRRGKLYIGHVGDSGIVMGYEDPETGFWRARPLTKDHKPESPDESSRINNAGGKVIIKSGVPRVVWNRPRIGHKGPVRRSTLIDEIPFLAVARSLGDLWSYNSEQDVFVVSPEPDVSVTEIDVHSHRCLILGTDGLWNMLSAQDAVNSVYFAEKNNERQPPHTHTMSDPLSKTWINPSKRLVDRALDRWFQHSLRADNTSVVTVVVDPPGPPKVKKDVCSAPVGISRYFPNKPQPPPSQAVAAQKTRDRDSTASTSTAANPTKLPSISSNPRAQKTPGSSSDSTQPVSSQTTSRAKKTRKGKGRPRTSLPGTTSPAGAISANADNTVQPAGAASAFYPVRHNRERNNVSTVATPVHDTRRNTTSSAPTDDVQIHEISSSSEANRSNERPSQGAKRQGKGRKPAAKTEIVSKKPKLLEGEGRLRPIKPVTRKGPMGRQRGTKVINGKVVMQTVTPEKTEKEDTSVTNSSSLIKVKKVLRKKVSPVKEETKTNSLEIQGKEKEVAAAISAKLLRRSTNSTKPPPVLEGSSHSQQSKRTSPATQSKAKVLRQAKIVAKGRVQKMKLKKSIKIKGNRKLAQLVDSERSLRSTTISPVRVLRSRK